MPHYRFNFLWMYSWGLAGRRNCPTSARSTSWPIWVSMQTRHSAIPYTVRLITDTPFRVFPLPDPRPRCYTGSATTPALI